MPKHDPTGPLPRIVRDAAEIRRRGEQVLDEVAARSRTDLRSRMDRLRIAAPLIAQSAVAAGLAWWLAEQFAEESVPPFFAPIAAVISLGSALGLRLRRSVELVVGVALGIGVGDLLIELIGTGTGQLVLIVGLAMTVAVILDGGQLMVLQAATSSVLVATLVPAGDSLGGLDRFRDALIGGAVGLVVGLLLFPLNPLSVAARSTRPVIAGLSTGLGALADAIGTDDGEAALAALEGMRRLDPAVAQLAAAVATGEEIARVAPIRWRSRDGSGRYAEAAVHLDYAVRNCRVLARRVQVMLRARHECPSEIVDAVRSLAAAMNAVEALLAGDTEPRAAREALLNAYALARGSLAAGTPDSVLTLVAQLRSIVYDLLRATGLNRLDALALLEG